MQEVEEEFLLFCPLLFALRLRGQTGSPSTSLRQEETRVLFCFCSGDQYKGFKLTTSQRSSAWIALFQRFSRERERERVAFPLFRRAHTQKECTSA